MGNKTIYRALIILIAVSAVVRLILSGILEFGNDEVYYWTYALYPDWSHFDHPPMVGLVIQFFTMDLLLKSEIFIRLGAVVFASINIYIIFLTGKAIKNPRTGLFAALLYTSSIYGFIISGTFILPDAPQMIFWLLSLLFFIRSQKNSSYWILLFGVTAGLGMISKYTSVFLWLGAGLYILFFNRKFLAKPALYISLIISLLFLLPVLLWNINNDWISFTFQGERVNFFGSGFRLDFLLTEIGGQIAYNNPVNFVIIIISLVALIKGKLFLEKQYSRILLLSSLPLILLFILFSAFRQTLPHWTAPAYVGLILLASAFLDHKASAGRIVPSGIKIALSLLVVVIILGVGQINYGWFIHDQNQDVRQLGKKEFSLDMYGWDQLKEKFEKEVLDDQPMSDRKLDIICYRWFPAANIDYYVATPLGIKVKAIGSLEKIHKYAWINRERGGFIKGSDAYFLTFSTDFYDPYELLGRYYSSILPLDTISIERGNSTVKNVFVYKLLDLKKVPSKEIN